MSGQKNEVIMAYHRKKWLFDLPIIVQINDFKNK